jgi:hypothetical protein
VPPQPAVEMIGPDCVRPGIAEKYLEMGPGRESLSETARMSSRTEFNKAIMLDRHGGQFRGFFAKLLK